MILRNPPLPIQVAEPRKVLCVSFLTDYFSSEIFENVTVGIATAEKFRHEKRYKEETSRHQQNKNFLEVELTCILLSCKFD